MSEETPKNVIRFPQKDGNRTIICDYCNAAIGENDFTTHIEKCRRKERQNLDREEQHE